MKEFEDIVDEIGGHGYFQQRLLYGALGPLFFILPFTCLIEIFALNIPKHWCKHPDGIINLDKWKDCYLPLEDQPDGTKDHSSCMMYPYDDTQSCPGNSSQKGANLVPCQDWSFDTSVFVSTTVSDNSWFCDRGEYITDAFFAGTVGAIVGVLTYNNLSDVLGRKPVFWFTMLLTVIFGIGRAFVSHIFWIYFLFKVISSSCIMAIFQIPLAIITEISDASYRSWLVGITCVLWTIGMSIIPLVAWLLKDWVKLTLVSVTPMALMIFTWPIIPESPRFLLTRRRIREAEAIILNISKTNGNQKPPKNLYRRLEYVSKKMKEEKVYGYVSLLSRRDLAFKTFCMSLANIASNFVYYNLSINIGNMAGDIFWNFFFLAIVEGPSNFLAIWLAEKAGRRWSHSFLVLLNFVCLLFNAITARTPSFSMAVRIVCMLAKINCTASFVVMYVQSIEIYPTSLRNTGMGFTTLVATLFGICGPHLVAIGRTHDARIPYAVMAILCLIGGIAASFLPETHGTELPETLDEAGTFGSDQKYFEWKRPNKCDKNKNTDSNDVKV